MLWRPVVMPTRVSEKKKNSDENPECGCSSKEDQSGVASISEPSGEYVYYGLVATGEGWI